MINNEKLLGKTLKCNQKYYNKIIFKHGNATKKRLNNVQV